MTGIADQLQAAVVTGWLLEGMKLMLYAVLILVAWHFLRRVFSK